MTSYFITQQNAYNLLLQYAISKMPKKSCSKLQDNKQKHDIFYEQSQDSINQYLKPYQKDNLFDKDISSEYPHLKLQSESIYQCDYGQEKFQELFQLNEHSVFDINRFANLDLDVGNVTHGLFSDFMLDQKEENGKNKKKRRGRKKKNAVIQNQMEEVKQKQNVPKWKFATKFESFYKYKLENNKLFQKKQ